MNTILKNVILDGKKQDISITGNRISQIGENLSVPGAEIINASNKIAVPAFYNTHTHAPMSIFRGYAEDLELMDWLQNHIWPIEAILTPDDIYWGTRLACLEMIHSGTVFLNDMYFCPMTVVKAVLDAGMRGAIAHTTISNAADTALNKANKAELEEFDELISNPPERIYPSVAPHAIYTVTEEDLLKQRQFATEKKTFLHIHVAETDFEVQQCKAQHNGMTPVEYLDSLGILAADTTAAHSVHLTEHDMEILAERQVLCAHCPCSNLKLASGLLKFSKMRDKGVRIALATDGNSSNNNLSMFDEMKTAAFMAKYTSGSQTAVKAKEIYNAATVAGAQAFGIDAGVLEVGKLADIVLLDANSTLLTPCTDLVSNLVYSADTSCVDTVICNGNVIMQNKIIPGEDEVLENARRVVKRVLK